MSETFVISDHHFGHANSLNFKKADGSPLRSFSCADEMDQHMIDTHNSVVGPNDKVIFLGDLVINKKHLHKIGQLNGKKKLIMGNHDIFDLSMYQQFFYDIKAYRVFDGHIFSHVPVHRESIGRFKANIHGHLHSNQVMLDGRIDPHYLCMCVEQDHINYTPMPWYMAKEILAARDIYK